MTASRPAARLTLRASRLARLLACLLAVSSVACTESHQTGGPTTRPDPYPAAYEAGRVEAEAEIARKDAKWLRVAGSADAPEASGIDRDTGLPWVAVDASDPNTTGRVAGHNAQLQSYIQQYGLPEGSRRRWDAQLFDLPAYFASQAKDGRAPDLPLDGHAVLSDDRHTALGWRRTPKGPEVTALVLVTDRTHGQVLPPLPVNAYPGKVQLAWGPPGADFAVLHWTAPNAPDAGDREGYSALDLRSGLWLRHERVGAAAGK